LHGMSRTLDADHRISPRSSVNIIKDTSVFNGDLSRNA
jgi:hypothetical protein